MSFVVSAASKAFSEMPSRLPVRGQAAIPTSLENMKARKNSQVGKAESCRYLHRKFDVRREELEPRDAETGVEGIAIMKDGDRSQASKAANCKYGHSSK